MWTLNLCGDGRTAAKVKASIAPAGSASESEKMVFHHPNALSASFGHPIVVDTDIPSSLGLPVDALKHTIVSKT